MIITEHIDLFDTSSEPVQLWFNVSYVAPSIDSEGIVTILKLKLDAVEVTEEEVMDRLGIDNLKDLIEDILEGLF